MARKVSLISDRDLARERLPIFAGSIMPQTIVMKELIDNEIDVVNEKDQPANKTIIKLSQNRIKLMDNGTGISTEINEDTGKSHIWTACAKMFSSSNYEGVQDSVGANGVGMTMANFTSAKFNVLNFNGENVKGYSFTDGFLNGTEESGVNEDGNYILNPLSYEEANEKFKPFFKNGFLVDVTWHKTPNKLFEDPASLSWLLNYINIRVGEINSGEVELFLYEDDDFEVETEHIILNKNKESEHYVKSWEEKVQENNGLILKDGPWSIAFSTNETMKIPPIVQGAPIKERFKVSAGIEIQNENIRVSVPYSLKYESKDYPPYTDQTKVDIRIPYNIIGRLFERSGDIYKHFYREAEKLYMSKVMKESDTSNFWPSLRKPEESELIIAEGYSAISGLKSQRDPKTQACIALRGKVLNCWNLDMQKAMRSDVVKQILNAVLHSNYKRIIIAVDADDDGGHIASLLTALFARFTNIIQDGKLYYVHTPHYLFKKFRSETKWSDNAADCPQGYHVTTLKGLGGMTPSEIDTFIMNHETRQLVQIVWDKDAEKNLDHAFSEGGEKWIIQDAI